jgi:hypothetical protein
MVWKRQDPCLFSKDAEKLLVKSFLWAVKRRRVVQAVSGKFYRSAKI